MSNERVQPGPPGKFEMAEVTDATFERDVLKNGKLTLVFFYSPTCGACRDMAATYAQIGIAFKDQFDFKKVNVSGNPAFAAKYAQLAGSQGGMPLTVILNKDGEILRDVRIQAGGMSIWQGDATNLQYFINWLNSVTNIANENW